MATSKCEPKFTSLWDKEFTITTHAVFDASTTEKGKGIPSGSNLNRSVAFSHAGYMPLGIVGWYCEGDYTSFVNVYELYLSARSAGSATVRCSVRNITGSGTSTAHAMDLKLTVYILWVKNE